MTPDDQQLAQHFAVLEPTPAQAERMQLQVEQRLSAHRPSLWSEWWGLLRARPVHNGGWMMAAAVVLLLSTPLGALGRLLQAAPNAQGSVTLSPARPLRLPHSLAVNLPRKMRARTHLSLVDGTGDFGSLQDGEPGLPASSDR